MPGCIYVVATPIGNLRDLSHRAQTTLAEVDAVICEDSRVTKKLLSAYGIKKPTLTYHSHSTNADTERIIERLVEGQSLALVTDAGTPLLSDPGNQLIQLSISKGIDVIPIPGPSALLAALVGSGVSPQPFIFLGFLPRTKSGQRETLGAYVELPLTLVIYEAANRLAGTLAHLCDICGPDRPACIARELTKRFETFERGSLIKLTKHFAEQEAKGEVVVVLGPPPVSSSQQRKDDLRNEARRLLKAGIKPSEAARTLAGAFGLPKKEAYSVILEETTTGPSDP